MFDLKLKPGISNAKEVQYEKVEYDLKAGNLSPATLRGSNTYKPCCFYSHWLLHELSEYVCSCFTFLRNITL